jgi:Tfp pilus assembly protein PilO
MKTVNFQTLPWYLRFLIFGAVAGVLYAGFWYFVTRGTRAETAEMAVQISDLKQRNAQAQIAQQRLNELQASYKARQEEYDELKALLPEQRELTMVLQGVQDRARSSSLSVEKFTPKDEVQQDFYSGKQIDVGVRSSFAGLRAFFEQMAHYQRIVSITNFEIKQMDKQAKDKTIDSTFSMTAYYVSAEKLKQAAKPAATGGQPNPAAAAAANAAQPAKQ